MKIVYQKNGSVLLLALLVMTGIVTISLATGTLIVNEIQQSSQLDRATVAFYAAESAVERGLYQTRKQDLSTAVINQLVALFENNASYTIIAQDSENAINQSLTQDETLQLDLYDPHSLSPLNPAIKSLRFAWAGNGSWLEIRWTCWTSSGILEQNTSQGVYISVSESPYILNLMDATNYLYKVRVTARQANISGLEVTSYDRINPAASPTCLPLGPSSACLINIPARVKIKGVGEYPHNDTKAAKQAILVTMPQVSPLSGLYDYVLFSEEEIKKEN
jgi:hypothetical protein